MSSNDYYDATEGWYICPECGSSDDIIEYRDRLIGHNRDGNHVSTKYWGCTQHFLMCDCGWDTI